MIIKKFVVGEMQENCYFAGDENELIIIDPGAEAVKLLNIVKTNGYKVKYIVLTHCHYDHIGAVCDIKEKTGASLVICEKEEKNYLTDSINLSSYFGGECPVVKPDILLKEGDILKSGEYEFKVIETPGHTSGGMCLLCGEHLFSGDTLFKQSIGRCDLPTGNMKELLSSIKTKLFTLDKSTKVYPGHGDDSTIDFEIKNNMFF